MGRVLGSCWKGFDFERQIFTPVDEFRLHKVFSLDFIQITYFVSISFQITYSLKCVNELQHEILSQLIICSTLGATLSESVGPVHARSLSVLNQRNISKTVLPATSRESEP